MTRLAVPERARELAAELQSMFVKDAELAERLNEAQRRLRSANDELWSGIHPEGLALLYDDTQAAGICDEGRTRSKVTAAMADTYRLNVDREDRDVYEAIETAALQVVQEIHWTIHRAFLDYQRVAEDRRQHAAAVGEVVARFVDALRAAGWSEDDARNASVDEIAGAGGGEAR